MWGIWCVFFKIGNIYEALIIDWNNMLVNREKNMCWPTESWRTSNDHKMGLPWNHRKPLAQTKMLRDSHAKGHVRPELLVPLHSRFWCWWCWCVRRNSQKTWQRHATTWFKPVNLARIGSRCLNSKQTATSDQRLVYVRKISQQALGVKHVVAAKVQVYHMLHTNIPLSGWGWGVLFDFSGRYSIYSIYIYDLARLRFILRIKSHCLTKPLLSSAAGDGGKAPLVVSSTVPGELFEGLKSREMFYFQSGDSKNVRSKACMIPGGKGKWEPTAVMPAEQESCSNPYSERLSLVFWKK